MKNVIIRLFWFFILLLFASSFVKTQNPFTQETFKGIVPFVTTRAEIEERFGKPDKYGRYEFDEGTAHIMYRRTECEKSDKSCSCLASPDAVLKIIASPYPEIMLVDLKLDPKLWKRFDVVGGHVPGIEVYINKKTGVTYEVDVEDGWVRSVIYEASEKTCKMLNERQP